MSNAQQSPTWQLHRGEALSLPPVGRERWLHVVDGEVWLTVSGTFAEPADDRWLLPGSQVLLPAHRAAVLEGHPQASFQLLEPAGVNAAASRRARAGWPVWAQRLSLTPDPPSVEPCPGC